MIRFPPGKIDLAKYFVPMAVLFHRAHYFVHFAFQVRKSDQYLGKLWGGYLRIVYCQVLLPFLTMYPFPVHFYVYIFVAQMTLRLSMIFIWDLKHTFAEQKPM